VKTAGQARPLRTAGQLPYFITMNEECEDFLHEFRLSPVAARFFPHFVALDGKPGP
jgi:hypothetical protein